MKYILLFLFVALAAPCSMDAQKPSALSKLPKEKFSANSATAKPPKPTHKDKLKSLGNHRRPDEIENPNVGEAFTTLEKGELDNAIDLLNDYSATDVDAAFGLGLAYYENDDAPSAIVALTHCIELDANNTDAMYVLALVYAEEGNYDQAEELFLQILETDPADADTWYELGALYHAAGFGEEAQYCLDAVLEIDPGYEDAHY